MMFGRFILIVIPAFFYFPCYGQVVTQCPQNIGFETGLFTNWQTYAGEISDTRPEAAPVVRPAVISLRQSAPLADQHLLIPRSDEKDYYGEFSLNAPNGSGYVVKLGNDYPGRGAESISYTIDVPSDVESYSIIFSYAVVFENPPHMYDEQPKFTARVFDLASNTSTDCGSFEFVAQGGLPGFQVSPYPGRHPVNNNNNNNNPDNPVQTPPPVLFRTWSPVLVNLSDYRGRSIRLEFTTNDCSRGGHFGYAYIDFNENCSIPLTGNVTCPETEEITLKTLPGFYGYKWYDAATSQVLGSTDSLVLRPVPPAGTRIAVELVPYPGLGCTQTLYTEINNMEMNISDPLPDCISVDLTDISLKVGNSSDITYSYWQNAEADEPIPDPRHVNVSGTYFIRGLSSSGCTLIRPVRVTIIPVPPVILNGILQATYPGTVDITRTFDHDPDMEYTYWRNREATIPLPDPGRVGRKAIYYIRSETPDGCIGITPVPVDILIPDIVVPNTFTPNGDGTNDVFTILLNSNVLVKYLRIFNRWGNVVFQTTDINNYWDGFKSSSQVPVGVYYWILEGVLDSKRYLRSGYITLLR